MEYFLLIFNIIIVTVYLVHGLWLFVRFLRW